ncbi:hypothetical protein [uncultured Paraglaciecola sp.]|uniref:hypothetical protein n=1 Tax=uncultured Paraglaciecola sp. TaxID=1765024 RepID=UPI0030DA762E
MSGLDPKNSAVSGEFIDRDGERYYAIRNVEKMPAFFISLVSDSDHWLFIASNGGLTAGRVSPEISLFPYVPVDRIYESNRHTGSKTLLKVTKGNKSFGWEPYNKDFNHQYCISQNLYKNTLGDKICFEEINHDLELAFCYSWKTSDKYGFCRQCELRNLSDDPISIKMIDGLQNILPAGTPRLTQSSSSNLIDAYKWNELEQSTGLAMFTVYSGITDRAQPSESLKANTVFSLGFEAPQILLSNTQLDKFWDDKTLQEETHKRGIRGAYLLNVEFELAANQSKPWQIVANVEQSQSQVCEMSQGLENPQNIANDIEHSIKQGSDELARIMAGTDGFQVTNEESVTVHHYANALFNTLRGGVFDDHFNISKTDFIGTLKTFNLPLYKKHQEVLVKFPEKLAFNQFTRLTQAINDRQIDRLVAEYLPVTFGRRHGDPSRPWNQFEIKLKDSKGNRLLSYQGNWRDIFQNWEALCFSYPEFIESVIAKFVNASTIDGYNPYRITKGGIDWEVEEPEDPWSFIGYWGDHQIIYLLKMLELSEKFHPQKLTNLLHQSIFCYANVPYRIKSFEAMLENAKSTVDYDEQSAMKIAQKVQSVGADGKLIWDDNGAVYQVNLLEKLLVPLLAKLANLVVEGGIWLNTQRPEWNDANNALVGHGVSVVTLNYLRRYVHFLQNLLAKQEKDVELSAQVAIWLQDTAQVLTELTPKLHHAVMTDELRFEVLQALGQAACKYRTSVYQKESFSHKVMTKLQSIQGLLDKALIVIDHSINKNSKDDGLFHSYNLLSLGDNKAQIKHLYPMLEGQVAALSSSAISPAKAADVLDALYSSDIFRADLNTFMLYPDKNQIGFLAKNIVPTEQVQKIPALMEMLKGKDPSIMTQDVRGNYRFNASLKNSSDLLAQLNELVPQYSELTAITMAQIKSLYEQVFNHQAFTGRSGGMFGFEGLGCVYWHMVSKLLLAVQEHFIQALDNDSEPQLVKRLGDLYYRVRQGIGFNKTPQEYGAFPCDPYSHTPKHAGAQQPGMTGQVKEELLTRFGELGISVTRGAVRFSPRLLRRQEFTQFSRNFRYLDLSEHWQEITLPSHSIAFTWCQVPIVYQLTEGDSTLTITLDSGKQLSSNVIGLEPSIANELFTRSGKVKSVNVLLNTNHLFE